MSRPVDRRPSVTDPGTDAAVIHFSSVSQVQAFELCARKWYFDKIRGIGQPTTARQQFGIEGHAQIEAYLMTGTDVLGRHARAGKHFLPDPLGADIEVETAILEEHKPDAEGLTADGVAFRGFIDLLNYGPTWRNNEGDDRPLEGAVEIVDWKFMGDLKWAKNATQLTESTQMIGYAEWVRRNFHVAAVRVSHGSFQAMGAPSAIKTSTLIMAETVKNLWESTDHTVAKMKIAARATRPDDVEPTYSSCGAYGGCSYRSVCPRSPGAALKQLFGISREKGGTSLSLLEKYKRRAAAVTPEVAAEVEKLKAEEISLKQTPEERAAIDEIIARPRGVVPPDAPKSEPPKSAMTIPDEALAGMHPAIQEVAKAFAAEGAIVEVTKHPTNALGDNIVVSPKPKGRPKKDAVAPQGMVPYPGASGLVVTVTAQPLALFIDAFVDGSIPVISLEPYIVEITAKVALAGNTDDIRSALDGPLSFGKWKGFLAAAVRECPPPMAHYTVTDVRESEIRQVVIEALRPLCHLYVRGR